MFRAEDSEEGRKLFDIGLPEDLSMRSYLNSFSRCKLRPGRKGSGEVLDDIRKNRAAGMPSEAIELSFALRAHLRWIFGETAYPGKFSVLMEHTPPLSVPAGRLTGRAETLPVGF